MLAHATFSQLIIFHSGIAFLASQPHLKAELVARMHVDGQKPIEAVMAHYGVNYADIYAALAYFYANQEQLNQAYETSWQAGLQSGQAIRSQDKLWQLLTRLINQHLPQGQPNYQVDELKQLPIVQLRDLVMSVYPSADDLLETLFQTQKDA